MGCNGAGTKEETGEDLAGNDGQQDKPRIRPLINKASYVVSVKESS